MADLGLDPKRTVTKLKRFIVDTLRSKGFDRVILGLSGGIDSTVVAYLAQAALGASNVIGVIMPYGRLSVDSTKDARYISDILKVKTEKIDISPMIDAYFSRHKDADGIRRGNKMARERMSILYDLSKRHNALVIGTSNKTERLLGYGTMYGDTVCALNPLGELYKTHVRQIARYLSVPKRIIDKTPSAGLWKGQTDEDELGYRYADIDRLLSLMVDRKMADSKLIQKGFKRKFIADIRTKIIENRFKSEPIPVARP